VRAVEAPRRGRHLHALHRPPRLAFRPLCARRRLRAAGRRGDRLLRALAGRLTLRPAAPADAPLLRRWDEAPHVVASGPNDDWRWEVELAGAGDWRKPQIAEVDGRPIGFVDVIDPAADPDRYWGDVPQGLRAVDIWIGAEDALGMGYGTRLMRLVLERCFADPSVHAVLVDPLASNVRAHRFYERLGFRFVERRTFGLDDCCVYRLERDEWLARTA
jgi:aminoglycoside 6'-N-acetyltransferase